MTTRVLLAAAILLLALPALAQPKHPAAQSLSPICHGQGKHKCPVPVPPPPPPPPVTLSITFNPANPVIPDNTPVGTLIADIVVTVSDGSAFTGSLGFGAPYGSDGGFCVLQGSQILLGVPPPRPSVQTCTITATQ